MNPRDWRARELRRMNQPALAALYRDHGGMGGIHEPETWSKHDLISSILDMEGHRLPMFTVTA